MPLIETRGAGSAQGFGEFAQSAAVNYIEDVFSTYLYDGNGSTQTITTGLDAAGGGLVWIKRRTGGTGFHTLVDSANNSNGRYYLASNSTDALIDTGASSYPLSSTGFSLNNGGSQTNGSGSTYVSWTFRKQAKFFDVVTYTGNGTAGRTVAHNLGSVPGCIIVRRLNTAQNWAVYHRSISATSLLILNETGASTSNIAYWNNTEPTDSVFTVGVSGLTNGSGDSYVAYLFAHNAGGFGLSGSDNVISCGSYTGTGAAGNPITLGYEPQYLLIKPSSMSGSWWVMDNMRPGALRPDSSAAESTSIGSPTLTVRPTATGFSFVDATLNDSSQTFIYIAIRRGPMKVPTSGTSVYNAIARNGTGAVANVTGVGFAPDLSLSSERGTVFVGDKLFFDKLRGANARLTSTATSAESSSATDMLTAFGMDGVTLGADANWYINKNANPYINWYFRRAPGFFDVVCYTGDGTTNRAITHNLTVIPEFIINKPRSYADYWEVYHKDLGVNSYIYLNSTNANGSSTGNWSSMTASAFGAGYAYAHNRTSETYVTYLFATVAGVSKVGSYTGTGTTKQIDCGFTGGARFVLIKRTDSTGDWYVWDTARGIVSGNDPYLLLNSTAAEVTNTDYVDTYSAGFELSSTAPAALNANGGSYIFLAIA